MQFLLYISLLGLNVITLPLLASSSIDLDVDGDHMELSDSLIHLEPSQELRIPFVSLTSATLHIKPAPETQFDFLKMVRIKRGPAIIRDLQEGIQSKPFDIILIAPDTQPALSGQAVILLTERSFLNPVEKTYLIRLTLGQPKEEK